MEKIGRYELREILGRGGMGVVYRAYDPLMDRDVAIKIVLEKALDTSEARARFIREARTAGKLSHENIMVIHDLGEIDGKTYIVMEYLIGKDLRSIIDAKEPLSLREKLNYAQQICRGLQYAHANLIIHRDIKPENIKVLGDGRVKVMDFGIAKPTSPVGEATTVDAEEGLTRVGMRIGTPWYMSPEQVKGTKVDKRADIFSFGVVLYELLTYRKPFEGDDTTVLYKILHEEPPPLLIEESGLTSELQRILSRCLAKDPEARYADCRLVDRDLELVASKPVDAGAVQQLMAEGEKLAEENRLGEATRKFEQILNIDPENEEAQSSLQWLGVGDNGAAMLRVINGKIVGDVISHFLIRERVGGGGMGVVYKAEDVTLKRTVALKFLIPDLVRDQTAKKRFLKEAQAASALDHPNICTIHEISEMEDGLIFICMAYYDGESLKKRISEGPLETGAILDIATRIARGLGKAHEHGIVHRDIKPANIVTTSDGEIKIVDFGLAKLSGGTRITRVGATMGTVPYMSPEQVKGMELDQRTDIWSFGVLLYQLTTGVLPFQGEYEAAVAHAIMSEEPVLPSQVRPGIPSGLEDIIRKCLSKALPGRYATMQEVLADLERVQKDLPRATSMDVVRSAELRRLVENGRNYMGKKQYDEALSRFDAALKLSPAEKQVISLRNETAKKLEEARQLNNLLREANTLYLRGKYDEAEDRLRAVSAIDPQHPEAAELTAAIRKKRERLEGLDKLLTDAGFYVKHGKFEEAAECYRQVLAIDPENKDAARGLEKAGKKKKEKTKKEEAKTPVPRSGRPPGKYIRAGIILTIACLVSGGIWSLFFHHRSQPEVSPQTPVADSSAIIGSLQQEAQSEKSRAAAAGAEQWAPSLFDSAQQRLNEGENSARSRAFGDATRLLGEAKSLFLSASEEAPKNEMASRANVEELTGMARDAREEMLKEKSAVDKMEGKREMPSRYAETSDQAEKAEALLAAGDRASLINARASFTRARDGYRKIRTEIDHLSDLRAGAESARARMAAAKRKVGGGDQEKKGNAAYLIALKSETNGERLFSSGEYHAAADTFAHASELFGMAESQTQILHAPAKEPPPVNIAALKEPEKADPAAKEKDDRDAADKAVTRIVDSYKTTIEQGRIRDLATLLDLSDDDQSGWSGFFKESTQRQVGIEEIQREVATDNARVSFKVKISYVNVKDNKQVAQPPFVNTWTMQRTGGGWKVVAHN